MSRLPDSPSSDPGPAAGVDCDWVSQHLDAVLDSEEMGRIAAPLGEHLRTCSGCAEAVRAAREEERFLRSALPKVHAPPGFVSATMERLAGKRDAARTTRRPALFLRIVLPMVSAAAALIIMLAIHFGTDGTRPANGVAATQAPGTAQPHPPSPVAAGAPAVATLSGYSGGVELLNEQGTSWMRAEPGVTLRAGATLRTATGALADVHFSDGVRVKLNGDSEARFTASRVSLQSGRLFVWADSRTSTFAVGTPQATAEIRGTMFNVDSRAEGRTTLTVVEGVVVFSNQAGRVEVGAGMQSSAEGAGAPDLPRSVDAAGIAAWAGVGGAGRHGQPGVRFRVRLDTSDGDGASGTPVFVVHFDYGDAGYASRRLRSEISDAAGKIVAERTVQVSTPVHRFRTKKVGFSGLDPGTYRASFRIAGGQDQPAKTLEFAVR